MDYNDYQDYDDENDYMDVEEAIEVPEKKSKKTDLNLDILENLNNTKPTEGRRVIDPTKVKERKPRILYNERSLTGERGLRALTKAFDGYKLPSDGKNPYQDMKEIMKKMELWAHSVAPNMNFNDFLVRTEQLGRKRPVKTHMLKIRLGMETMEPEDEAEADEAAKTEKSAKTKKGKKPEGEPIHFC